jgi:hypothetical protein
MLFGLTMNASQNVLFSGDPPLDAEFNYPPGATIAHLVNDALRDRGYEPSTIDNWRDCGWFFNLSINDGRYEISLAQTSSNNQWILQIACTNDPGTIARLFGKRFVDRSDTLHEIAAAIQGILESNGYTELRWRLDGFPDDSESTSEPSHARGMAK